MKNKLLNGGFSHLKRRGLGLFTVAAVLMLSSTPAIAGFDESFHHFEMKLTDPAQATVVATQGMDISTVPDASVVHIPAGIQAFVRGNSSRIHSIIIDGDLQMRANSKNINLYVQTIWLKASGNLTIRAGKGFKADVVFHNDQPFNHDNPALPYFDPAQEGGGLISLGGKLRVFGKHKTAWGYAKSVPAGQDYIVMNQAPVNWNVGDEIVVGAVERDHTSGEIVKIASIAGNVIHLATPITNSHVLPAHNHQTKVLAVPVGNLTRAVTFRTAPESIAAGNTLHRAHVMIMNSGHGKMAIKEHDTKVQNAAFVDMGRTDKTRLIADAKFDARNNLVRPASNTRARYPIHFHRAGPGSALGVVEGCVVDGSPGWGFVNHNSNVAFTDNVTYGTPGAGFVTEASNETGSFIRNAAFASITPRKFKNHQDMRGNSNFGIQGDGFWFQGASIDVVDNVASGFSGSGFALYGVSIDHPAAGGGGSGSIPFYIESKYMGFPNGQVYVHANRNGIRSFIGNTAYSGKSAMFVWSSSPKDRRQKAAAAHYNELTNFTAVNVAQGINTSYARGTRFNDAIFINDPAAPFGSTKVVTRPVSSSITTTGTTYVEGFSSAGAPLNNNVAPPPPPVIVPTLPPTPALEGLKATHNWYHIKNMKKGSTFTFNPTADDFTSTPDGKVWITSVTQPKYGVIVINANGSLSYTKGKISKKGRRVIDGIWYTVTDSAGRIAKAKAIMRVR